MVCPSRRSRKLERRSPRCQHVKRVASKVHRDLPSAAAKKPNHDQVFQLAKLSQKIRRTLYDRRSSHHRPEFAACTRVSNPRRPKQNVCGLRTAVLKRSSHQSTDFDYSVVLRNWPLHRFDRVLKNFSVGPFTAIPITLTVRCRNRLRRTTSLIMP